MKMKIFIILLLSAVAIQAQVLESELKTRDTIRVKILSVLPDSFPNVQLVIKANSQNGFPLWNLTESDIRVFENKDSCAIKAFKSITKQLPITMVIVVDHSLSMLLDAGQVMSDYDFYFPDNLRKRSPLARAKKAIRNFVNEFDNDKDQIGLVAFSSEVSKSVQPTIEKSQILNQLNGLLEDGSTAYYDAVYEALEMLKDKDGLKYVIALTDGEDNMSSHSLQEVIELANGYEIPVFNIGLGDVKQLPLQEMSSQTQGEFFYAKKSTDLQKVYEEVKRKISALYSVVYTSPVMSSQDTAREIAIVFDVDNAVSLNEAYSYYLPQNVRAKLQEIEQAKANEQLHVYAAMAVAAVITAFGLFIVWRRKKEKEYYT